jgi:biotin transporter BioY
LLGIGLPVFAVLFGPTGGYILGFCTIIAFALGNVTIYAFGLPWLAFFVGWYQVLQMGFLLFLPGDLLKMILAVLVIRSVFK